MVNDEQRFQHAGFRRVKLLPLSQEQQRAALEQRLGVERASALQPYLERMPLDEQSRERITANPRERGQLEPRCARTRF